MKILCKVKPNYDVCCTCIDEKTDKGECVNCPICLARTPDYEVLKLGRDFWNGDWAMVLNDEGEIERVPLSRVVNVRTIHSPIQETTESFRVMTENFKLY